MLLGLKRISTALVLLVGPAALTFAQAPVSTSNQSTADAVAGALKASRALAGYRIEIETRDGLVTLTGTLANSAQKVEAMNRAQRVPGVVGVIDQLKVGRDTRVQAAQYQPGPYLGAPGQPMPNQPRVAFGGHHRAGAGVGGDEIIYDGAPTGAPTSGAAIGGQPFEGGPSRRRRRRCRIHGRDPRTRPAELFMAELRALSEFLGRGLPDGLPLAGLAEHLGPVSLSRSTPRLARRHPPLG